MSHPSPSSPRISQAGPKASPLPTPSPTPLKPQVFYAIVLHDFVAERADELDAKSGDSITVVAQSNREWFVAKPIGRIGRPGLIPVSFVQLQDPTSGKSIGDVNGLIDRGDIPRVEDWKRSVFDYKQNSIPLGVIDTPNRESVFTTTQPSRSNSLGPSFERARARPPSPNQPNYTNGESASVAETCEPLPEGLLLAADVVSFHYEMDEYWFRIDAIFQPYPEPGQNGLPPAKQLILFRVYNDFYDFQVSLLDTFPREAGRQPPQKRVLPYMPGPAEEVDDRLTATRRVELNEYVHSLCDLGKRGHRYILEHQVVREFLGLKPGDVENETDPRVQEIDALLSNLHGSRDIRGSGRDEYDRDVQESFGKMRMDDAAHKSDGSDYEDEGYAASHDHHSYGRGRARLSSDSDPRIHAHSQDHHQRTGSSTSFRTHSPYASTSRSSSPLHPERGSPQPPRAPGSHHYYHHASAASTSSFRSQPTSRSRSQSTAAASNLNSPSISATNPQPAFVKIKIFDRVADDLIAIRVHPRVTHGELMDKVQTRLGGEVANLRYRDSMTGTFVGLDSDEDLRTWVESTDKHVLFAD